MAKRSIKTTRVNEEVLRALSEILRDGLKDPRIAPFTSVVSVEVAPDLKTAKAYLSVLDDARVEETLEGIKSSAGFIRNQLARRINLRNTPEITFHIDQSIANGIRMSKMIDEVIGNQKNDDAID